LYGLALRWQLTAVGRDLHRRALAQNVKVNCGLSGIRLRRGKRDMWFLAQDAVYAWASLEDLDWFERRLFFKLVKGHEVADCRGRQRYRLLPTEDSIELPLPPEPHDIISGYFQRGEPAEGEVVFDGGAFCGEVTIYMAKKVGPRGHVFAFEPDWKNCLWLRRNIEQAGLKNITVVEKGLWKETTRLQFATGKDWTSHLVTNSSSGHVVEVPVIGFEDACYIAGSVPNFVKMDIEGAEVETVEGALDYIGRNRIRFAIASYHDRNGQPTSAFLEPMFKRAGYQVETGFPAHPTTWAWKDE
jgi:FkbM family methyltransferase